ncbi:MAG: ATP-binding protein, partial [Thermoanaerobaculia bacterium]
MKSFKFLSLRTKIIFIILIIAVFTIISTISFFIINDLKRFKRELINSAYLISKIIGDYSVYDLTFGLKGEAEKKLKLLGTIQNVEVATIYDSEREVFASFSRGGEGVGIKFSEKKGYFFKGNSLFYYKPIINNGREMGYVFLQLSSLEMKNRIKTYLTFLLFFLLFLILITSLIALWLQGYVSKPIIKLSEMLKEVASSRDYSKKFQRETNDEIGVLVQGFNHLLSEIQKQQAERDEFERALKISEQKFYHIIEQSNDALYVLYNEKILFVNPKFENYFGLTMRDIRTKGVSFLNIIPEEEKENIRERLKKIQEKEEVPNKFIFKGISRTGDIRWYEANESEIIWDDRFATLGIVRDITERVEYENRLKEKEEILSQYSKELERSNKELDQFAYVTSHDLKAPLRAISNLVTWIEEDSKDKLDEAVKSNMELLKSRVKRMENLINGILEYSRIGRIKGTIERIDFEKMVREIIDSLDPPKTFNFSIKKGLEPFYAEKIRLEQVFSNLISNAIKHHHKGGGNIEISFEDFGDYIEFKVSDDGPGIPEEYHSKIFEIFNTLKARDKFESTGIGLTIVKKIV